MNPFLNYARGDTPRDLTRMDFCDMVQEKPSSVELPVLGSTSTELDELGESTSTRGGDWDDQLSFSTPMLQTYPYGSELEIDDEDLDSFTPFSDGRDLAQPYSSFLETRASYWTSEPTLKTCASTQRHFGAAKDNEVTLHGFQPSLSATANLTDALSQTTSLIHSLPKPTGPEQPRQYRFLNETIRGSNCATPSSQSLVHCTWDHRYQSNHTSTPPSSVHDSSSSSAGCFDDLLSNAYLIDSPSRLRRSRGPQTCSTCGRTLANQEGLR